MSWFLNNLWMLLCIVVMMAAWSVPGFDTWGFWIGLLAFAFHDALKGP